MMDDCLMTEYHILIDTDMICSAWFNGEVVEVYHKIRVLF